MTNPDPATSPAPILLKIINKGRDQITLDVPVLDTDGHRKRDAAGRFMVKPLLIGSWDDRNVVGTPQPEIEIMSDVWDLLLQQKAVKGMVDERILSVYKA